MRVQILHMPIWHYRLMLAGRPEWMAGNRRERNKSRRWYANKDQVNQAIARIMKTDEHLELVQKYVQITFWADIRGFREQSVEMWLFGLLTAIRERGLDK